MYPRSSSSCSSTTKMKIKSSWKIWMTRMLLLDLPTSTTCRRNAKDSTNKTFSKGSKCHRLNLSLILSTKYDHARLVDVNYRCWKIPKRADIKWIIWTDNCRLSDIFEDFRVFTIEIWFCAGNCLDCYVTAAFGLTSLDKLFRLFSSDMISRNAEQTRSLCELDFPRTAAIELYPSSMHNFDIYLIQTFPES